MQSSYGRPGAAVELQGITKTYPGNDYPSVNIQWLEVPQGDFFTLMGPNGCGKSTTLRMIAGLDTPDKGAIFLYGEPAALVETGYSLPPEKRDIGMVFQASAAIWPHMNVGDNVAFPLQTRKYPKQEIRSLVAETLELVGMPGMEKEKATMLRDAQRQQVALARALVAKPRLLVLDEPFTHLDRRLREHMRNEVRRIKDERRGMTVLFVTHDSTEAFAVSDTIAVMDTGRIIQQGSPRQVKETPVNDTVRQFFQEVEQAPR